MRRRGSWSGDGKLLIWRDSVLGIPPRGFLGEGTSLALVSGRGPGRTWGRGLAVRPGSQWSGGTLKVEGLVSGALWLLPLGRGPRRGHSGALAFLKDRRRGLWGRGTTLSRGVLWPRTLATCALQAPSVGGDGAGAAPCPGKSEPPPLAPPLAPPPSPRRPSCPRRERRRRRDRAPWSRSERPGPSRRRPGAPRRAPKPPAPSVRPCTPRPPSRRPSRAPPQPEPPPGGDGRSPRLSEPGGTPWAGSRRGRPAAAPSGPGPPGRRGPRRPGWRSRRQGQGLGPTRAAGAAATDG